MRSLPTPMHAIVPLVKIVSFLKPGENEVREDWLGRIGLISTCELFAPL